MKRVLITERQYKLGNNVLATSSQLKKLKEKLDNLNTLSTKDKIREWMQSVFILGQLLARADSKNIASKEGIMFEYDSIVKKVDDLTEI